MAPAAPPRAVVFDAVGTLIHADPPVADVYHLAGWQHGSQLGREEVGRRMRAAFAAAEAGEGLVRAATSEDFERERWRRIVTAVFDDVPDAGEGLFRTLWQHFAEPDHWRLYPEAAAVLGELADRGYRLAIASNFDRRLHAIVRADPALRCCERSFVSSEIGYPKPDGRFFANIEQQLGLSPDELLLVGDDWINDIGGARAAGWRAIYVARRESEADGEGIQTLLPLLTMLEAR